MTACSSSNSRPIHLGSPVAFMDCSKQCLTKFLGISPRMLRGTAVVDSFLLWDPGIVSNELLRLPNSALMSNHTKAWRWKSARLTTDDWPYFYQHEPGLPLIIVIMSVLPVLVTRLLIRQTGAAGQAINWHFFFLGAGFLLLEAQIVSRMAMLFGTTWLVNSIVIAAILVLIVAANFLVASWPAIPVRLAYVGIGVCMFISYLLPLEMLFFQTFWIKALVATLVLCSPVAFASIVFVRGFADCNFSGQALGSNLLGAL